MVIKRFRMLSRGGLEGFYARTQKRHVRTTGMGAGGPCDVQVYLNLPPGRKISHWDAENVGLGMRYHPPVSSFGAKKSSFIFLLVPASRDSLVSGTRYDS